MVFFKFNFRGLNLLPYKALRRVLLNQKEGGNFSSFLFLYIILIYNLSANSSNVLAVVFNSEIDAAISSKAAD